MAGYGLDFFSCEPYRKDWWGSLTPAKAKACARRARQAGCSPAARSPEKFGVAVAWVGPSVGSVLSKLKDIRKQEASHARSDPSRGAPEQLGVR